MGPQFRQVLPVDEHAPAAGTPSNNGGGLVAKGPNPHVVPLCRAGPLIGGSCETGVGHTKVTGWRESSDKGVKGGQNAICRDVL